MFQDLSLVMAVGTRGLEASCSTGAALGDALAVTYLGFVLTQVL
jgi:hypothetical protein